MEKSLPITGCLATRECKVNERGRALKIIFRTDLRHTCINIMLITMSFDSIMFPLVILFYTVCVEKTRKFKFNVKHLIDFESNFSLRTAPVSEISPIR